MLGETLRSVVVATPASRSSRSGEFLSTAPTRDAGVATTGCRKALRDLAASRRSFLRSRSIGQLFNRTHRMSFTAALQEDGITDSPSVAVKKLDLPALYSRLAPGGGDEPSRGGGVDR